MKLSYQPYELEGQDDVYIVEDVLKLYPVTISERRWFHAHPELSFEEVETASKIASLLRDMGITEVYEGIGVTGVVGIIRGEAGEGPCVGLRADMDALPLQETATVEYRSLNDGKMHACGHDGHVSGLLCAARVIFSRRSAMKGVVKLIFQPAEEGRGGAPAMIRDGVLEAVLGPRVDFVYGIHLWTHGKLGEVLCSEGPVMAASDKFFIDVVGKGGHGAAPQGTVDAIVEAAALVTSLQTIISRNKDPLESGVVTCGTINGGYGYNIIADRVNITGTCRSFTKDTQELIKTRMQDVCCGVAKTYGGEINMTYDYGYPPTINAYPDCVKVVNNASSKVVGDKRSGLVQKTMGAEDFSYFLEQRPGCFFFVGAALPGDFRPHHKSVFDFDEKALLISASIYVTIISDLLSS